MTPLSSFHGESFDFSSSFNQRLLVDILNLVFLANFLLGTINENRRRRRSWDSAFVSILCIAIGVAYFAGAGGVLYKEGNGFLVAIFSLRGLIWIALSVSINVHSSNWFRAILLIWWSSFPLLITALNANQLVKSHHLPLLDIIEWPATLILLFHALKLIIRGLFNGGITGESLSHYLLEEEDVEEEEEEGIRSSNIGKAGIFSRLTFAWLNPLLHLGNSRALELKDIPSLDTEDEAVHAYRSFSREWDQLRRSKERKNNLVLFALARCYWKEMMLVGFYALLKSISIAVSPLILYAFVWYSNLVHRELRVGLALVACLLIVKLIESLSQRHWFFDSRRYGMRMRSAVMAALYQKELKISSNGRKRHSTGEIVNYIAVDAYRLGEFPWWLQMAWSLPLQLLFSVSILFGTVGIGALPGIVPLVIFGFLNVPVAKMLQHFQSQFMVAQDERLRATSEVLNSMKIIKLQSWEEHFRNTIESLRGAEFKWLRDTQLTKAFGGALYWISPTVISGVIFAGTAATRSAPLNAATIFTVLATLRVMSEPVRMLPEVLSVLIQVKVSLDRIDTFLQEEEVKEDDVKRSPLQNSNLVAEISNGVFSWDQTYASPTLRNINLQIERGQKIAVCGAVGSGKSSLLYALLGEIPKISGSVCVNGSIAYVPQTSWIQSGTLRDNILYGKAMKNEAYRKAIRCCALDKDVENFDHGDLTEIGQRGLNMSGGQKQRIQLARAVYSDADIYILDDPFSAVDAHTASILFHDCVMAALEKKTVILVTHQVEFLPQSDMILVMEGGRVIQTGRYQELLMSGTTFEQLVTAHRSSVTTLNSTDRLPTMAGDPLKQSGEGEISIKGVVSAVQLTEEEQTETGNSGWKPYKDYIQVSKGSFLLALILISQSIFIILQSLSFYWLASAVQIHRINDAMLVVVFSTVSLASCIFLIARSLFTAQLGLRASKQFFSGFMDSVFKAPMTFFDSTPIGRILTRASSDLCILDFDIPYSISFMLVGAIEVVTTIVIIATVTWQVLLVAVPVLIFMIYVQNYYLASSRELVRINGTTKAPVMNFAGESLLGVVTIRAFGTVERFFCANLKLIDTDAKLFFHTAGVMEWVLLRVEALQSLTILASTAFLVFLPQGTIAPAPELEAGGKPASHGGLKDELRILRREEGLAKITTKTTTTKTVAGLSPSTVSAGGEEEFLLPEFNELVLKDFETSCKELDSTHSTPARSDSKEDCSSVEQEISQLKNLVFSLQEREQNLELQLPEYSGMLEREAAARELESQMKIHNMESQLFLLKIESLQSENQRLQALVLDHSRVMGELDAAKGKIKSLKRKAKLDGEQAREKISSLHQMIGGLQDKERDDLEMERMLKELEGEAGSLGRRNSSLAVENLELKHKLESVETIFNSAMDGRKAEELEEVQHLKQSNGKLSKEVEQLQITRCSDVEELVYLRWVNACLRYELRNYQPPQGKTAARDLSKNLSPRSEERAKQLILEYVNSHTDGKGALSPGDLDDYSSSHASTGESDDVFLEDPSVNPKHGSSKSKLFSKLKKLVLGKDHRSSRVNDTFGRDSFESFSSSVTEEIGAVDQTPGDGLPNDERGGSGKHARPRKSLMDFQRLRRILLKGRERKGDSLKRAVSEDCLMGSAHSKVDGNRENEIPERKELRKYAEVLRGSHGAQMAFRKSTSSAIDDY